MAIDKLTSDETQGLLGPTQGVVVERINQVIDEVNSNTSAVADGGALPYVPVAPTDWVAPPATVGEALDRIAAVVAVLNAGPIP